MFILSYFLFWNAIYKAIISCDYKTSKDHTNINTELNYYIFFTFYTNLQF